MNGIKQCEQCGTGALASDKYCVVCGVNFPDNQVKRRINEDMPVLNNNNNNNVGTLTKKPPQIRLRRHSGSKKQRRIKPATIAFLAVIALMIIVWGMFSLNKPDIAQKLLPNMQREQTRTTETVNYDLPAFTSKILHKTQAPAGYTTIFNREQLIAINDDLTADYILMRDIDLGGHATPFTPIGVIDGRYYTSLSEIGGFAGTFDGNGFQITGMYIKADNLQQSQVASMGLFALLLDGHIKNLGVSGTIELSGRPGSYTFAGGIAGANIAIEKESGIENCTFAGSIQGAEYAGGISGLSAAYHERTTASIAYCKNAGQIAGRLAGGIAGFMDATKADSSVTIWYCNNYGAISSQFAQTGRAGGIAGVAQALGENTQASINGCANNGDILGKDHAGGLIGAAVIQEGGGVYCTASYNKGAVLGNKSGGGIIGAGYFEDQGKEIALQYCYNAGGVSGNKTSVGAILPTNIKEELPRLNMSYCFYTIESGSKDERAAVCEKSELFSLLQADGNGHFKKGALENDLPEVSIKYDLITK